MAESGNRYIEWRVRPGQTLAEISARQHVLTTRDLANRYWADQKTILLYGEGWIPVQNSAWVGDDHVGLTREREGQLYLANLATDTYILATWSESGFRIVA